MEVIQDDSVLDVEGAGVGISFEEGSKFSDGASKIGLTDMLGSVKAAANVASVADEAVESIGEMPGIQSASGARSAVADAFTTHSNFVTDIATDMWDKAQNGIFTTDASTGDVVTGYQLGESNQWGWITLYVVTILIAVVGNIFFIKSCLCTRRTRSTGYYLLMNLSIRDLIVSGLCIPFTLDSEIISMTWNYGNEMCISFRFFYYFGLFFLPLTIMFITFHLFVENCKWNFVGEEGAVPRPWTHSIYIPLIWLFSGIFAAPMAFLSEVQDENQDIYRNILAMRPAGAKICMHRGGEDWLPSSNFFYVTSTILTFILPVVLLVLPWFALFIQICACCTRKLRNSEFWLSFIALLLALIFEASRAPFEVFNVHHILTEWHLIKMQPLIHFDECYRALMKWAVYVPALIHPILYFTFLPEARHGMAILFGRCCACCCTKSTVDDCNITGRSDAELALGGTDDEKGRMLPNCNSNSNNALHRIDANNACITMSLSNTTQEMIDSSDSVPLQSKMEEEM